MMLMLPNPVQVPILFPSDMSPFIDEDRMLV
jgi:hypothetical protein